MESEGFMRLIVGFANGKEKRFIVDKVKVDDLMGQLVFYNYDFGYETPAGRMFLSQVTYWYLED